MIWVRRIPRMRFWLLGWGSRQEVARHFVLRSNGAATGDVDARVLAVRESDLETDHFAFQGSLCPSSGTLTAQNSPISGPRTTRLVAGFGKGSVSASSLQSTINKQANEIKEAQDRSGRLRRQRFSAPGPPDVSAGHGGSMRLATCPDVRLAAQLTALTLEARSVDSRCALVLGSQRPRVP